MPAQYRAIWLVPGGGVGYSVFHFALAGTQGNANSIATATHNFMASLVGQLPDDVHITFDAEVLDLTDGGELVAVWGVTPPAQVAGTGVGSYARAVGARIDWATGKIVNGHRLNGRTYVVPLVGSAFDTTGNLIASVAQSITDQATAFIAATQASSRLVVWSRTHSISWPVTTASTPVVGAILRGRRD